MQKEILSEQAVYFGDINMPKGFEIDRDKLSKDIIQSKIKNSNIPFSKNLTLLDTYISDHVRLEHNKTLITKKSWGNIYKPNQISEPLLDIDKNDLAHSPDFTVLYGSEVKDCIVRIYYNDNRRKGYIWEKPLNNNEFIMFPSSNYYILINNQKDSLNLIYSITYECL